MNSLLEITQIKRPHHRILHGYMTDVENAYIACLDNAKRAGQIPATHDTRKYARFVMGSTLSMRAMAKLKAPSVMIDDVRACTLKALAA